MIEQKRQWEALELISDLEQLAVEVQLKTRIIDTLRDRKKELQSPLTDGEWEKELLLIDETVTYMERQLSGGETDIVVNDGNTVSRDEVLNRIQEIWTHCRETNRILKESYRRTQAVSRQELESNMMDWTNIAANYEIMSNPARFHSKCHETGQIYKQHLDSLAVEYVEESAGEYEQSMNKIKGLIASVGRGQVSVTTRDIYEKWDNRQELIRRKLKQGAEQLEKGDRDISEFGQAHTDPMNRIVRQKKMKRMIYCWIPLFVILGFFLLKGGISYIKTSLSRSEEQTAIQEEDSFTDKIVSGVEDKAADKISDKFVEIFFKKAGKVLLPLFVLLVLVWFLWIRYTQKLYREWLIRDLERYIKPQTERFWKENIIINRDDACFQELEHMVEQCYDDVFKDLFGDVCGTEQENSSAFRMKKLKRHWNEVKHM